MHVCLSIYSMGSFLSLSIASTDNIAKNRRAGALCPFLESRVQDGLPTSGFQDWNSTFIPPAFLSANTR
jgi:hypothetical protein